MAKATSYEFSRRFWDFCFANPEKVKPNHVAIYFFAVEHCNRLGWKEKFGLPTEMVKDAVGIKSWHTYISAFNDLVEWKFFFLVERSKNQYSSNIIALIKNDEALDEALDKAITKHTSKQLQSTHQSNDSIDKQIQNNTVTNNQEQRGGEKKPFNEISDFEQLGFQFPISEPVKKAFDQFLQYRFDRKEAIVSAIVIEKMIKDMWVRSNKDEDMIRMIDFTIAKSAKNIITDCDLSAKIETESEREARIRKNWDTPIGTLDRLFG